jgi:hypothetical protein
MKFAVALALVFAATPALAQRYSRPYADEWERAPLEGLYAAIGGGGQLMIADSNNAFGYDGEARIGYSFDPRLAFYLSGSIDSASFLGANLHVETIALFLQYHLYARPQLMVFARAGVGLGLSTDLAPPDVNGASTTSAGLAGADGLGVEIRIAPGLYLAPELFYKNMSLSGGGFSDDISVIGIDVALVYY